jgi:LysM repeat protein
MRVPLVEKKGLVKQSQYQLTSERTHSNLALTIYVVRQGDSVYSIANRYGVSPQEVINQNQIENPERLVIGQALVIPVESIQHRVTSGESL